jgi:hypothetical protein
MTTIFVLYGESTAALAALAVNRGARLLRNTIREFDQLADDNDGTHETPPVLAIGSKGFVGLATTVDA